MSHMNVPMNIQHNTSYLFVTPSYVIPSITAKSQEDINGDMTKGTYIADYTPQLRTFELQECNQK